jgi:CheY-like chemotaxis protein
MDLQMPVMGGLEACSLIRKREQQFALPRVPIIAMTAHALRGDRERCLEAGMDGYVTKPVLVGALRAELLRVLGPGGIDHDEGTVKSASGMPQASVSFDRAWMLEQIGGDEGLMHEVIGIFLNDVDDSHKRLIDAIEAMDAKAVREAAHAIKGAVGNFGAKDVVAAAFALEKAGEQGRTGVFAELGDKLSGPLQNLKAALENELAQAGA